MSKIKAAVLAFAKNEEGMETLEYALIAGLIAVVAVLVYVGDWGATLKQRLESATEAGPPVQ